MKILTWDIETSPNVADVWGIFDQNIGLSQLRARQRAICFAAKWYGQDRVQFYAEWLKNGHGGSARAEVFTPPGSDGRKPNQTYPGLGSGFAPKGYDRSKVDFDPTTGLGHEGMIRAAWHLLDAADAVISYNGKSYDRRHMNREFARYGLGKPSPRVEIDLLMTVRGEMKMTSTKLQDVARYFLGDTKTVHAGHDLWVQVLAGDPRGLRKMATYNRQDVRLAERLYDFFNGQGWIVNGPNMAIGADEKTCPGCGAEDALRGNGTRVASARTYQRYRCRFCGVSATGGRFVAKAETRVLR